MKTATLTLKRKVLVIEPPEETRFKKYVEYLVTHDTEHLFLLPKGKWKCLGSPDDLKESDLVDLVENKGSYYKNYSPIHGSVQGNITFTALESFNSALEKEIYWDVNPIEKPPKNDLNGSFFIMQQNFHKENEYEEAETRTFDITRTLIFVEN